MDDINNTNNKVYGVLRLDLGNQFFRTVPLDKTLYAGNSKDNEIVLEDESIASRQACFYIEKDHPYIKNLGEIIPTKVNKTPITKDPCPIREGDVIEIGNCKITFGQFLEEKPLVVNLKLHPLSYYKMEEIMEARAVLFMFPTDDDKINQIYEIMRQRFDKLPLSDMEKINLDASLTEAIGNAQRHGHNYNPDKIIQLLLISDSECFVMKVIDEGEGFDPKQELVRKVAAENAARNVENARERYKCGGYGGLGIMLMTKCVDEVDYNPKGNEVTLTKYMGKSAKKAKEAKQATLAQEPSEPILIESSEPVVDGKEDFGENAKNRIEKKPTTLTRKVMVRYFNRMYPNHNFPLLVAFSQERLKQIKQNAVSQVEAKEDIKIRKEYPYVQVIPIFPGCICVPDKITLDVTPELSQAKFWLTPNTEGVLEDARVDIVYYGKTVSSISAPTKVTKQTWAKISIAFTCLAPVISALIEMLEIDVKKSLPFLLAGLRDMVENFGGSTTLGMGLAALGIFFAIILYFINRPKQAEPLESFFKVE